MRLQCCGIRDVGLWLERQGLGVVDLSDALVSEYLEDRRRRERFVSSGGAIVRLFVDHLQRQGVVATPKPVGEESSRERLVRRYTAHLEGERGVVLVTEGSGRSRSEPGEKGPLSVLSSGTCGTTPCWKLLGSTLVPKGDKYKDQDGLPHDLDGLTLKAGLEGKAKMSLKAKGLNIPMPALGNFALPLTTQLQSGNGKCYEATFSSAGVKANTSLLFKAKSDGAP